MINRGKHSVLGINIDAVDYDFATRKVIDAAHEGKPCSVSALAVHGVMTGREDDAHRRRLNGLDLVVPDGQPVRWAIKWLHDVELPDRVYGPNLTLRLIEAAANEAVPVYFYGSKSETLELLSTRLQAKYPNLKIAGMEPSKFRQITEEEKEQVVARIKDSGAKLVFVGLGCPRQEVWAYEYRQALSMPLIAVGAAFDFHAGTLPQAPSWMQDRGLEWVFRFWQEPTRLWKRYVILNPKYLWSISRQSRKPEAYQIEGPRGDEPLQSFG